MLLLNKSPRARHAETYPCHGTPTMAHSQPPDTNITGKGTSDRQRGDRVSIIIQTDRTIRMCQCVKFGKVATYYPFGQFCDIYVYIHIYIYIYVSLLGLRKQTNTAPNLFRRGVEHGNFAQQSLSREYKRGSVEKGSLLFALGFKLSHDFQTEATLLRSKVKGSLHRPLLYSVLHRTSRL